MKGPIYSWGAVLLILGLLLMLALIAGAATPPSPSSTAGWEAQTVPRVVDHVPVNTLCRLEQQRDLVQIDWGERLIDLLSARTFNTYQRLRLALGTGSVTNFCDCTITSASYGAGDYKTARQIGLPLRC